MKLARFRSEEGKAKFARAYGAALSDGPEPTATIDIPTTFGTVRVYEWAGSEPGEDPLVLLPGRTAGAPMWSENLADLRTIGPTLVAMDALGDAGMSVQTAPLRSMADQARWVDEALDALGHSRVHLLGHSFGGATAAAVAMHHPTRLASLILFEPTFTFRWPPASTILWAMLSTLPVPTSWRDHALAEIGGVPVADVRASTPIGDMIAVAAAHFTSSLPVPRPLSDSQLARLTMPVYVAIAARSVAGGEKAAQRARALLPHAQVDVWPDTTHSLPMQESQRLTARVRAFLDESRKPLD